MDRHIRVIADLIDQGDCGCSAKADAPGFVLENRLCLICNTSDVAWNGGIFTDVLQHLDAGSYCFVWTRQ